MDKICKYDVAISFANEDRNAAIALVLALEMAGFKRIYYYPKKRAHGWGKGLKKLLTKIYSEEAKYAIVLFSNHYFGKEKIYTKDIELKAIEMRMESDDNVTYMLPIILDESFNFKNYPSLGDDLKYVKWEYDPEGIVTELIELFGIKIADPTPREKENKYNTITINGSKVDKMDIKQAGRDVVTNNYTGS